MTAQSIYRYPLKDSDRHKLWVRFKRIDFEWQATGEGASQDDAFGRMVANSGSEQPSVYLYLPPSINLKDSSNFGTQDLGGVGRMFEQFVNSSGLGVAGAEDAATRLGNALDVGVRSLTSTLETGMALFGGSGETGLNQGAISLAMSRIPFANNTPLGTGVASAIRQNANPHRRSMFESVNLRDFSFQFEFMPDNEDEARQMLAIVKFFRELAYPTTTNLPIGQAGLGETGELAAFQEIANTLVYTFPSMVQVDMFYKLEDETVDILNQVAVNNQEVEELFSTEGQDEILNSGLYRVGHRFLPCYVTGVDQTLDSQNSMVYRRLEPTSITSSGPQDAFAVPTAQTLSVSLSEDRAIDANAVRNGY